MCRPVRLFTIGFTKKPAERFFALLQNAGVARVIDTRLNNVSQLAGFAKRDDLAFFLRAVAGIGYEHRPTLAPTADLLDAYKKKGGDWHAYAERFAELIRGRRIEDADPAAFDGGCLLCSEDAPHHCHRRLVAEYLADKWGNVEVVHLR